MLLRRSAMWRRAELVLFAVGFLCVGYVGVIKVQAAGARREADAFGRNSRSGPYVVRQQDSGMVPVDADAGAGRPAFVMGRLEIPQIALSVPIMSDYETNSLLKGVGHVTGTAMPGGLGTLGLAGHRDTYFRPLSKIEKDMDIRVRDTSGVYHYVVDSTEIVKPDQVSVLDIRDRPGLTLITCYPFHYVGAAPLRFIVHAHLLSVIPD